MRGAKREESNVPVRFLGCRTGRAGVWLVRVRTQVRVGREHKMVLFESCSVDWANGILKKMLIRELEQRSRALGKSWRSEFGSHHFERSVC